MSRPRKHYVVIQMGRIETVIYHGLAEAARRSRQLTDFDISACHLGFTTHTAAEEFICWWQYEKEPHIGALWTSHTTE